MIPPPERPRFYNLRAKVRRAAAVAFNEGMLGVLLARRSWLWVVRGPSRIRGHAVLRRLVLGFPAVAVAGAAVTVLVLNPKADQISLRSRYRGEAEHALTAGRWDDALVRYQRLAADAGYRPDDVYGVARALDGEGRQAKAQALFLRLAPDNTTGHPDAHFRRAMQLLAQTPPATLGAERHLLRAIHARPDFAAAHNLLGQLKMKEGDADAAAKHLLLAVGTFPDLKLTLAVFYRGRDADASARWAKEAVEHFGGATQAHPDDANIRCRFVLALSLTHQYQEAAEVIRAGLVRADDVQLRKLAGDVYAEWCAALTGETRAAERFRRIEEGLELNPNAGPLLIALATTAGGAGPVAEAARTYAARRLETGGPGSVGLRLALGIEAQRRGDVVTARRLIGGAYRDDPDSPGAANNLAYLLIQDPDPDPARALTIVETALKSRPDEPSLRDTRGQILVRLGRWKEATQDLEFSVVRIPPNRATYRALARAYRELNLITLAESQERKADDLPR